MTVAHQDDEFALAPHPIDMLERTVEDNGWAFERSGRDASSSPVRSVPPATAAPNGADANGTAPRLSVEHVKQLSETCEGGS